MARKKIARKAKKTIRNQAKVAMMKSVETIEKTFRDMPRQVVALCQKELSTLKQHEKKLAVELKKAQSLVNAIKDKCSILENANRTASTKKRLAAAKKGLVKANTAVKEMTAKYNQLDKQINSCTDTQNKYVALSKELSKFDTQWKKLAKKPSAPKKAAKKTATKSSKSIVEAGIETTHEAATVAQEAQHDAESTEIEVVS